MGGGEGGSGGVVNQCVTVESEKLIDDSVALEKGSRSMKHINRYHSIANQMPLPGIGGGIRGWETRESFQVAE